MKKLLFYLAAIPMLWGCVHDLSNDGSDIASVTTGEASEITSTSAVITSSVQLYPGAESPVFGVVLSKNNNPTPDNGMEVTTTELSPENTFSVTAQDLDPETVYYYKAFVRIAGIDTYGNVQDFTTELNVTNYLTFVSKGTTSLYLQNIGDNNPVLFYSTDKIKWAPWDYSELVFTSECPVYISGDNPEGFSHSYTQRSCFIAVGDNYEVYGSVMSLLNKEYEMKAIPCECCFYKLFNEGDYSQKPAGLIQAPELPAETLSKSCYAAMFLACSGLTQAPALPASSLAELCYECMFECCYSLTQAPILPATTLAKSCYSRMFFNCESLVQAPVLPATSLADNCYASMFQFCYSLAWAPQLPAKILAHSCYSFMFSACSSLTKAPDLPATTLAEFCYFYMFQYCSGLTQAPVLPATNLANGCYAGMFFNCTSLTQAPVLPAEFMVSNCYGSMFEGCSNLNYIDSHANVMNDRYCRSWVKGVAAKGTFIKSPIIRYWTTGVDCIPTGWTTKNGDYTPSPIYGNGYEYVDLGLPSKLKWATMNIGAIHIGHYGNYYAWGELQTKSLYDGSSYLLGKYTNGILNINYYNTSDNWTVLKLYDDIANVAWGGGWRMPTSDEYRELLDYCTWSKETVSGVNGYLLTSKKNGNTIFFPMGGLICGSTEYYKGEMVCYWTSSKTLTDNYRALSFENWNGTLKNNYAEERVNGLTVRAVIDSAD